MPIDFDEEPDKNKPTAGELLAKAKQSILKQSKKIDGIEIHGYDFSKPFNFNEFVKSYGSTGFQASNLASAIEIIKEMKKEKATIFLAYTSNVVSSGLRDVVRYLVQNKFPSVLITTAGGIEEDIMKTMNPFILGDFRAKGKEMRESGINRIGNIFVPNDRYMAYEDFTKPVFEKLYAEQQKGKSITPSYLTKNLGEATNNTNSIYYWAAKHSIPVFCPGIIDGSTGDMLYFFRQSHPEMKIEVLEDHAKMINTAINANKTGIIILGAGIVKHMACNANLFREGADYAVYLNTADEFDGSDAGALVEEAISWGKVKPTAKHVKVHADVTLAFPLIVAALKDVIEKGF